MKSIRNIRAEDTYEIRKQELRKNVSLSHKMKGDHDPDTLHLGMFLNEDLIGIASFMRASLSDFKGSQYQLRGMATAEAYQGRGYGRELLKAAEALLQKRGIEVLWCNARVVALDFYRKLGYTSLGNAFEVPEIGMHYRMFKKLN